MMIATRHDAREEYEALCSETSKQSRRSSLYMLQSRGGLTMSALGLGFAVLGVSSVVSYTFGILGVLMSAHAFYMLRRCTRALRELQPRWERLRKACNALEVDCPCGACESKRDE